MPPDSIQLVGVVQPTAFLTVISVTEIDGVIEAWD